MSGKKHALSLAFLILLIVGTFWFLLKDIGFAGLFNAIKKGIIEPDRCEKCEYCKNTKVLTEPTDSTEFYLI